MIVLGFRSTSLHDECLQLYISRSDLGSKFCTENRSPLSCDRHAAILQLVPLRIPCWTSPQVTCTSHEQRPLHARQRNKVTTLGHSVMLKPQHEACHHAGVAAGPGPGTGIPAAAAGGRSAGGAAARAAVAHRLYSGHPVDCRLLRARHQPPLHILTHHPRMRQLEPVLLKHREPTYKHVPPLAR